LEKKSWIEASSQLQRGYASSALMDGLELKKRIGARSKWPLHGSGTW
jgi:hypothetical protein